MPSFGESMSSEELAESTYSSADTRVSVVGVGGAGESVVGGKEDCVTVGKGVYVG